MKEYTIIKDGIKIKSNKPGKYAGWNGGSKNKKIFGTLDCASGKRMNKENRVFFHSIEDAIKSGYRPCKKCKPISQERYEEIKNDLGENKMNSFEKNLFEVSKEINELAAEAGIGREKKPVIRYYLGGNPKPIKFEDLPPESQKNARMFADKHKGLLKKLGGGNFDTENGYDINFMADGKVKVTSPSTGISDTVRIN